MLPLHLKHKDNLIKTLYIITFLGIISSIIFRVYCSNILAEKNSELRSLYSKKIDIEKELSRLSYIDAELSSLKAIESRAKSNGFIELQGTLLSIDTDSPSSVAALTGR